MEAQLERPSHGHEGGTHSVVEGGEQKKSVLKKVKDKAKKIKDTIKKHGHGHQHHDHDHQEEEEEEEEEEVDEDPEVHGAPMYESSVVRSTSLPMENTNFDNPNQNHHHHERERESPAPAMKQNINALTESPAEELHSPNNTPVGTQDSSDSSSKPLSETASEYAHKFAETLAPVYGKVGGATTGVINKEYLSEKLKPGDEDKALSEAITGALLHKKKDEEPPPPPPRAKVTVSKEVAERLGTDRESKREGEDAVAAGEESTGETVAERLQNAVATWLSGSTGMQTAQDSVYNAFVNDAGGAGAQRDEPRHE